MKVLLVNGSPHKNGSTYTALCEVSDALNENGVDTDIFWIGNKPLSGCIACKKCREKNQCVFDDAVNEFLEIAGTTATWDQVNKYFGLMQMPIISSRYWNIVHGTNPDEVKQDLEGMQVMQILGNNMAYFINCKNVATKMGIEKPKAPDFVFTNFIR